MSGNGEKALADAQACVKLEPKWIKGYGRVAAALQFIGDEDESYKFYTAGLKLATGHRGLAAGRVALGKAKRATTEDLQSSCKRAKYTNQNDTAGLHGGDGTETSYENEINEFVDDVSSLGNTVRKDKRAVDDSCVGTSQEEIGRLLQRNHKWINLNPYIVLSLPHDTATHEDVKQRYRALCQLIHPDKCDDARAVAAFEIVHQAYTELMDKERRKIVDAIINNAHAAAAREWRQSTRNEDCGKSDLGHQKHVATMKAFAEAARRKKVAEDNLHAYRRREKVQAASDKAKLRQTRDAEREWRRGMSDRVSSWRNFNASGSKINCKSRGTKQGK